MPDIIATTTLALDRESFRKSDQDGHLRVAQNNISMATVNDYLGCEIPGFENLGLEPRKIYAMLRDPKELEASAETFDGKPLLFNHRPVTADDHAHEMVVGAVNDVRYEHPYLKGKISVWVGEAIRAIEDGSQKELSAGYHYKPVMESGTYEGKAFDGRMTEIKANHLALVPVGRAGKTVVVGDSAESLLEHLAAAGVAARQIVAAQPATDAPNGRAGPTTPRGAPTGTLIMAKHALSGAAAHTQGALVTHFRPKLAQDAKVDLGPILIGLTAKNFNARKPALALGLQNALRGKIAQDEDGEIADVPALIDAIGEVVEEIAEQTGETPEEIAAKAAATAGDPPPAEDDADMAAFKAMLKDKGLADDVVDEICAAVAKMMPDDGDAVVPGTIVGDGTAAKAPAKPAMDAKNFISRSEAERLADQKASAAERRAAVAMDAAIAAERKRGEDLRTAYDAVEPWVGKLAIACDSAEVVYRKALESLHVPEAKTAPADALWPILRAQPKPGDAPRPSARAALAQDAAGKPQTYAEMFPHADRLAS